MPADDEIGSTEITSVRLKSTKCHMKELLFKSIELRRIVVAIIENFLYVSCLLDSHFFSSPSKKISRLGRRKESKFSQPYDIFVTVNKIVIIIKFVG